MRRIEFAAETLEELVDMARRWVAAYPELQAAVGAQPSGSERLEDVLARVTSSASRQFLREVAARTLAGEALPRGRTLVGVLGVANRTMRRRAGRELVSWDPQAGGYRVSLDDARIIVDTLGPPTTGVAGPPQVGDQAGGSISSP